MNFPIRLTRDCDFLAWDDDAIASWSSTMLVHGSPDILMRSDGIPKINYASFSLRIDHTMTLVNRVSSGGIHIKGPDDGDELTPYAWNALAYTEDPNLFPAVFCAISPAAPTSDAAGDTCKECRYLAFPTTSNDDALGGSFVQASGVVALPKTDHIAADRNIAFGIAFISGLGVPATSMCMGQLNVRRLVNFEPMILDRTKKG